jgi:hypothetical protein
VVGALGTLAGERQVAEHHLRLAAAGLANVEPPCVKATMSQVRRNLFPEVSFLKRLLPLFDPRTMSVPDDFVPITRILLLFMKEGFRESYSKEWTISPRKYSFNPGILLVGM